MTEGKAKAKWEPKQSDIDWQRNMLNMCSNGAIWGASCGIYHVDKKNKVLRRTLGGTDEETHERIIIVLEELGWTMGDECK